MAGLFALTLFVSAFLLFQVQPMVGKMLLPKLGGTPAVWDTCLVFFQAVLLAGYAYAHGATSRLGNHRQSLIHFAVLALPAISLPIVIGDESFRSRQAIDNPTLLVFSQLARTVGLPFFVIATTAPLLQSWFSATGHSSAKDPYFLYVASNCGSLLALIAYPMLIEPRLTLDDQSAVWTWMYGVYALLICICALTLWTRRSTQANQDESAPAASEPLTSRRRLRWIAIAFVPSSLLLGTTTYISTDIAPIPLLWVVPLALYLLSFIIVFARKPFIRLSLANRLLPIAILMLTLVLATGATELRGLPVWILLGIHLFAFFLAAIVAHGELAADRPPPRHLTQFYLWISVGGVLGGLFNALLAPIVFRHMGLAEYPLALILSCFLCRPRYDTTRSFHWVDLLWPLLIGVLTFLLIRIAGLLKLPPGPFQTGLAFGLPCILVFLLVDRPYRFGIGVAAILTASAFNPSEERLFLERNFFGVVRVADIRGPEGGSFRALYHGDTIHGQMDLEHTDGEGRRVPLTYYHPTGPLGVACRRWFANRSEGQRIGAIGLGTGSIAYYTRPGDSLTFYEIDPVIQRVAEDPKFFTFMRDCRSGPPRVVLGDAYLKLQEAEDHSFHLLILDAFSSDSIPVHLLTREAIALYRQKLRPDGVMAFHISNRYLNLRPIVAKLAEDAGMVIRGWRDLSGNKMTGKFDSEWLLVATDEWSFGPLVYSVHWRTGLVPLPRFAKDARWETCRSMPDTPLWTNNFSNLLSAFGRDEEDP